MVRETGRIIKQREAVKTAWALFGFSLLVRAAWTFLCARNSLLPSYMLNLHEDFLEVAKYYAGLPGGVDHIGRPPLYSFFLAAFLKTTGERIGIIIAVQIVLSALTTLFPYILFRRYKDERAGIIGSLLMAIDPLLVYFSPHLVAEVFFVPLLLLFFWAAFIAFESGSMPWAAGTGLAAGLAAMARASLIPYFYLLPVMIFFCRRPRRETLQQIALMALGLAALTVPWALRNEARYHRFSIAYYSGRALYEGLAVTWQETQDVPEAMQQEMKANPKSEVEWDDIFHQRAIDWIKTHPAQYANILARKAIKFWRPAPEKPFPRLGRWGVGAFSIALSILALCGAWLFREHREASALLWIFLALTTAIHAVCFNRLRYRVPIEPVFCLWAGLALAHLQRRFLGEKPGSP